MQFISMDLVGPFLVSGHGHRYALTVICMLTGYVFAIPIPNKEADTVVKAYLSEVYAKFGGSWKILSDNGTEFKNDLFQKVAKELGVTHKIYTAPYHPQSNGRIEGVHRFLKACVGKHVGPNLEWDEVVPLAVSAYNFFPNEHSRESPFFLMFGRDPMTPTNTLLGPRIRYFGNDFSMMSLEALRRCYQIVTDNLRFAKQRREAPHRVLTRAIVPGDSVLVKQHTATGWEPRYLEGHRVIKLVGKTKALVRDGAGHEREVHLDDLKFHFPAETLADEPIPFGRMARFRVPTHQVEDLGWKTTSALSSIVKSVARVSDSLVTVNACEIKLSTRPWISSTATTPKDVSRDEPPKKQTVKSH
jgi:hypothetical protein